MRVFEVKGMSCAHCVKAVTQALLTADNEAVVDVDLAASEVRVGSALSSEQIMALIADEGYEVKARA